MVVCLQIELISRNDNSNEILYIYNTTFLIAIGIVNSIDEIQSEVPLRVKKGVVGVNYKQGHLSLTNGTVC